jgi:hypothetical protein
VAGVPKVVDPLPLVRAMRGAGLPVHRPLVRGFAVAEVALGGWALLAPGRYAAGLVGAAYHGVTAVVARVLTRGGVGGSCGCLGKPDTPATRTHLGLTALAALTAAAVAVAPPTGAWSDVDAATVTTAGFAVVLGFLAWMVMAVLPTTSPAAIRTTSTTRPPTRD